MQKSPLTELKLTIPPFKLNGINEPTERLRLPPSTYYLNYPFNAKRSTFLSNPLIKPIHFPHETVKNNPSYNQHSPPSIPTQFFIPIINIPTYGAKSHTYSKEPASFCNLPPLADPWESLVKEESETASTNNNNETFIKKEEALDDHGFNCKYEADSIIKEEEKEMRTVKIECKMEPMDFEEEEIKQKTKKELQKKPKVEKESDEEYVVKPKKSSTKKKGHKKQKAQNRIKNLPGLIMQRVKTLVKNYFSSFNRQNTFEPKPLFVHKILQDVNKLDQTRFSHFLDQYEKHWKTWKTIIEFLERNPRYGKVMLELVAEFLGPLGEEDFNEWLKNGKMCTKSILTIQDAKKLLASKFDAITLETKQEEDLVHKIIKKEES